MTSRRSFSVVAMLVLLSGLLVVGVFAFAEQLIHGDVVTGMRSVGAGGAVWGLYIVMDGYCLGAGVAVMAAACIARFSRDRNLEAVARIAMPVALTCFLGAGLCVMADQGRPLVALRSLALYARPQSPLFVTFTVVSAVCLFGSLVYCVLARRPDLAEYAKRPTFWQPLQRLLAAGYTGTEGQRYRRQKVGFWMSLFMLPAMLAPLTALAIVFTVRPARPLSLAFFEVVSFLILSFTGGLGLLICASAMVGWLAGREAGLHVHAFARLGRALLLATTISVLSVVVAEIACLESGEAAVMNCARSLLGDAYGYLYWGEVVLLFIAAGVLWYASYQRRLLPRTVMGVGVLLQIPVFLQHYLLLVAWQTHGLSLPYRPGVYWPTWIEFAVVLGIIALSILLLLPAIRLIPFTPLVISDRSVRRRGRDLLRTIMTGLWLVLGLAATAAGLSLSGRVGTESFQDPILYGSPMLFIGGLVVLVMTGAVYELLPERK
jgi:Ni/Fe-hydrogenase subunit HybB-like protein